MAILDIFKFSKSDSNDQLNILAKILDAVRPQNTLIPTTNNLAYPLYPLPAQKMYEISYNSDVLSTIHNALKRETFRNGVELIKALATDKDTSTAEEDVNPNDTEYTKILDKIMDINENHQTILDVYKEMEDDFNILDDAYLFFGFDYGFNRKGEIVEKVFREALRLHPALMALVINKQDRPGFDDSGNELIACPQHRTNLMSNPDPLKTVYCKTCGKKMHRVIYKHTYATDEHVYYFDWEIIHRSRYRPSKRLGYSPIFTVWEKINILKAQDQYMLELYQGKRPPKSLLLLNTSNRDSVQKAWDQMIQRTKENPHTPGVLAIENNGMGNGSKSFAEFFDFMKSLDEMQFTEAREEFRRTIGAVYGVLPLFQADVASSGGLNNEGQQITVTNRTIAECQRIYNEVFLPQTLKAMGLEGWVLQLRPSEEEDDTRKLTRQKMSLENGRLAIDLGLRAEYDKDSAEVIIYDGELQKAQQMDAFGNPIGGTPGADNNPKDPKEEPKGDGESSKKPESSTPSDVETKKKIDEVKKAVTPKRPPFTPLAQILKEEVRNFIKQYNRKPTEEELTKTIEIVRGKMVGTLQKVHEAHIKRTYQRAIEDIEKENNQNIIFGRRDENAIQALASQKILYDSFKGMTDETIIKLQDLLTTEYMNPEGININKIEAKVEALTDVIDFRAENIARTETSKIASAARYTSYAKEEDFNEAKFKHAGPHDHRTTECCKRIMQRTAKGVPWTDYVQIMKEESARDFPEFSVDEFAPVPHYQCRHIPLRMR